MAKDPAFLFYPGDWLGGTIGMTFEEKGAYMELLMMQFTRGHMTERMIHQTVGQLWVNLKDKFEKDAEGLWFNSRLDIEKEKRKNYVDSRKNNKNGSNQHTSKPKKTKGHMTSHMEDVNVNRNEDKDFERGVGKNFDSFESEPHRDMSLKVLQDFGFTPIRDAGKLSYISMSLKYIQTSGEMDYFVEQYQPYWEFKKQSGGMEQSAETFFDWNNQFKNPGWKKMNWNKQLENLKKSVKPDKMKSTVEAFAAAENPFRNKQQ